MRIPGHNTLLTGLFICLYLLNATAYADLKNQQTDSIGKDSLPAITAPAEKASPTPATSTAAPEKPEEHAPITYSADPELDIPLQTSKPIQTHKKTRLPEAEYWKKKVNNELDNRSDYQQSDINSLFTELNDAFDHSSQKFMQRSWRSADTTAPDKADKKTTDTLPYKLATTRQEIFNTIYTLYYQRLRVMNSISGNLQDEVTGTGIEGVEEFYRELTFLRVTFSHRLYELPRLLDDRLQDLESAPLPIIWDLVKLAIIFMVFRYWFRWAPRGLVNIRTQLMKARPRTKRNLRLIKLVWYFDQIRRPIAWMLILSIIFTLSDDPALTFFIEVARITIRWVLLSWIGILFVNAVISRNSNALKTENAALILRTLQYLGVWLMLTGLNLNLIARYTGTGTLYSWTILASQVILLAVLIRLLALWRPNIRQGCINEPHKNYFTHMVLKDKPGLIGYLYSMAGGLYLLRIYASKKILEWAATFNTGQQMVDSLIGLDIARAYQLQHKDPDAEPIPAQLEQKITSLNVELLRQVGNAMVKNILSRAEEKNGGLIILTGETGCGKSTILQRVIRETEKTALLVSCPKEGIDGLVKEMARKLHMDTEQSTRKLVSEELKQKNIDVLLIDDIHRLIRPYVGGQQQLDKLVEILEKSPNILVVLALNTASWQFIQRARDHRMFERNALIIQPWTADQIGSLIKNASTASEIEPDYSQVIIPRQYDNSNVDDPQERAFTGFARMLHSASMGNPKIAIGLWIKSLYQKNEKIIVQLPELPSSDELDKASLTMLLVLRVICQTEIISFEDIVNSLQLDPGIATAALRVAQQNHWVESLDNDYYQLNWEWRRVISRVLSRKNLMPRLS